MAAVRNQAITSANEPEVQENTSGLEAAGRAVLVRPYEQKLKGGIIAIPEEVKKRMDMVEQRAVVIDIGESAWQDELQPRAKVGDHVVITRYAGWNAGPDVTADGQSYRLVNDRDIFCRIKKGARNG